MSSGELLVWVPKPPVYLGCPGRVYCNRHVANKTRYKLHPFKGSRRAAGCTMNSLYTHGVRQTNSLTADLERLRNGDNSASLLGLLNSLLTFEGKGLR
jgi:hypothetical protein